MNKRIQKKQLKRKEEQKSKVITSLVQHLQEVVAEVAIVPNVSGTITPGQKEIKNLVQDYCKKEYPNCQVNTELTYDELTNVINGRVTLSPLCFPIDIVVKDKNSKDLE